MANRKRRGGKSAPQTMTGGCLCGAVRYRTPEIKTDVAVCHCGMCRRWAGGPLAGVHFKGEISFRGEKFIGTWRASDWGERGFCKRCGTTLFWRLQDRSETVLAAGTFDRQDKFVMTNQIFIDQKPDFYDFAQETRTMTQAEVFALFAPDTPAAEAEAPPSDDAKQTGEAIAEPSHAAESLAQEHAAEAPADTASDAEQSSEDTAEKVVDDAVVLDAAAAEQLDAAPADAVGAEADVKP